MVKKYKFPLDRRAIYVSAIVIYLAIFSSALMSYFFSEQGSYLSIWYMLLLIFVFSLYIISSPRSLVVYKDRIEVRCVLKLVIVQKEDIVKVRRLPRAELKFLIPILGSAGFLGYYGLYFNLSKREFVRVYAGTKEDFIQITDSNRTNHIVNVKDSRSFIKEIS